MYQGLFSVFLLNSEDIKRQGKTFYLIKTSYLNCIVCLFLINSFIYFYSYVN